MSDEAPLARPVASAVLALVVAAVVLACFQIEETDLFWHLAAPAMIGGFFQSIPVLFAKV